MYGRKPNLPIDNLLFRENYEQPIENLQQYREYMQANQRNLFAAMQRERSARFVRNKRASGQNKVNRTYEVGDKVYLTFPKGRFRQVGGSTKLAPRNDGPYTVLERIQDGLVYSVQHDATGFIHTTFVGRMIPVTKMIIPSNAIDLPLPDKCKQMVERDDRINDMTEQKYLEKQQELQKANDEAMTNVKKDDMKDENAEMKHEMKHEAMQHAAQSAHTEPDVQLILDENTFQIEDEGMSAEQHVAMCKERDAHKPKHKKTKPTHIEQDSQAAAQTAPRATAQPPSDDPQEDKNPYRKVYAPSTRAERMEQRAQKEQQLTSLYLFLAPFANKESQNSNNQLRRRQRAVQRMRRVEQFKAGATEGERDRVTPRKGREAWVRLDTHSGSAPRVGSTHCTSQQWLGSVGQ
jgi:hypothetical protein